LIPASLDRQSLDGQVLTGRLPLAKLATASITGSGDNLAATKAAFLSLFSKSLPKIPAAGLGTAVRPFGLS
jgi:hypothetical protein